MTRETPKFPDIFNNRKRYSKTFYSLTVFFLWPSRYIGQTRGFFRDMSNGGTSELIAPCMSDSTWKQRKCLEHQMESQPTPFHTQAHWRSLVWRYMYEAALCFAKLAFNFATRLIRNIKSVTKVRKTIGTPRP